MVGLGRGTALESVGPRGGFGFLSMLGLGDSKKWGRAGALESGGEVEAWTREGLEDPGVLCDTSHGD